MDFTLKKTGAWNKITFTEEQKDYVVEKYLTNKDASTVTIAEEFGVSYPIIRKILNEREINSKTLSSFRQIYDVNQDFFEVIDTEHKAYWLGFLYADGVIIEKENLVRINLSYVDKCHLEKFKISLKSNHPIKDTYKKTSKKIYNLNYIAIKNSKMCKDLIDKGCYQNKSLTLKFPVGKIPENLIHHFIRGYFDGDGCISYSVTTKKHTKRRLYKISMIGTEDFLTYILQYLGSNLKPKKERNRNQYSIYLGGNQQVKRIVEYLYKDATVFLDRKKLKSDECLQYIQDNPYVTWNKGLKGE